MHLMPLSASSAPPEPTSRERLNSTITHFQALVDQWEPEIKTDLENCEKWRSSALKNDKLAGWGLKGAVAGGVLAMVGAGVSLAMGLGTHGVFPGLGVFLVGITVCQVACMRRDSAQMEYQMTFPSVKHRQELLKTRAYPQLEQARAALLKQDTEEMTALADGLRQVGNIMETKDSLVVGGTLIRKR